MQTHGVDNDADTLIDSDCWLKVDDGVVWSSLGDLDEKKKVLASSQLAGENGWWRGHLYFTFGLFLTFISFSSSEISPFACSSLKCGTYCIDSGQLQFVLGIPLRPQHTLGGGCRKAFSSHVTLRSRL